METVALFDIDNTITPPRQPITKQMVDILDRLSVPFSVAAGSHLSLLEKQFFEPLFKFGYRKQFSAFLSNGAIQYQCDFSKKISINVIKSFDIRKHLGEADYKFLLETIKTTQELPAFKLPASIKILGDTIAFRGSMVNFAPIGRLKEEGSKAQLNRKNFVEFDQTSKYREKVLKHLNDTLSSLIKNKDLKITLGGQTSFDIGIIGKDKTNAVRTLFDIGFKRVVFFGDALFEGGNDYAIRAFEKNTPPKPPLSIETVQVNSYEETIKRLYDFNFIKK